MIMNKINARKNLHRLRINWPFQVDKKEGWKQRNIFKLEKYSKIAVQIHQEQLISMSKLNYSQYKVSILIHS